MSKPANVMFLSGEFDEIPELRFFNGDGDKGESLPFLCPLKILLFVVVIRNEAPLPDVFIEDFYNFLLLKRLIKFPGEL